MSEAGEYITVKNEAEDSFVERKSRFIGHCRPVATEEEALAFIARIKKENWDASHNVHAYVLKNGGVMRFSDDGEPQGTAGIPVLDALRKSGVVDTVIVATRYFGGVLLGAGGLVRAYSHTASIALTAAGKIKMKACDILCCSCDYATYGKVNSVIPESGGIIEDVEFLEDVKITFHIFPELRTAFEKNLADASNGRVSAEYIETEYFEFEI